MPILCLRGLIASANRRYWHLALSLQSNAPDRLRSRGAEHITYHPRRFQSECTAGHPVWAERPSGKTAHLPSTKQDQRCGLPAIRALRTGRSPKIQWATSLTWLRFLNLQSGLHRHSDRRAAGCRDMLPEVVISHFTAEGYRGPQQSVALSAARRRSVPPSLIVRAHSARPAPPVSGRRPDDSPYPAPVAAPLSMPAQAATTGQPSRRKRE